jgi:hypothetical protein
VFRVAWLVVPMMMAATAIMSARFATMATCGVR